MRSVIGETTRGHDGRSSESLVTIFHRDVVLDSAPRDVASLDVDFMALLAGPGKRKRGGQKGRKGAKRELLDPSAVDEIVNFFPDVCLGCATELPKTPDPHARRTQHVDLIDYGPWTTEYRRHEVSCPSCGKKTPAAYDPHKIPASAFGPRLTSVVVFLMGVYHISRVNTVQLIEDLFGISISVGTISAMEARALRTPREREGRTDMTELIRAAAAVLGERAACDALGVARSTYRRHLMPACTRPMKPRSGGRALWAAERERVLAVLHEERFADLPVPQVHAMLLAEGVHLCSQRTMYRILDSVGENQERRNIRRYVDAVKPQLLATGPNQLWSWDTTKLRGPRKWTYFYLYVIIDVFSRHIVGWMVATRESKALATKLIRETCKKHKIAPGTLTLHADRGSSMTSKPVAFLCADLGVTKTHSRPYQSNDNPFSESNFKTMKYRPEFPESFGCIEDARAFVRDFVDWYNLEHHHSGLAMFTPHDVHYGLVDEKVAVRAAALRQAYERNPESASLMARRR